MVINAIFLDGSNLTLVERRPNVFSFNFRVPSLVLIVTHEDPLSAENIRRLRQAPAAEKSSIQAEILALQKRAEAFFARALKPTPLVLTGGPLDEQRQQFTRLYEKDHLKLLCRSAVFRLVNEFEERGGNFDVQVQLAHADLSEYLTKESVVGAKEPVHVGLYRYIYHYI